MESILGKIERIAKKSGDSQKELDTAKNNLEKIKKISRDSTPIIDLLSKPRSNSVVEKNLSMSELVQINGSPVFRVAFPSSSSSSSGNVQQGQCTSDVSNSPR